MQAAKSIAEHSGFPVRMPNNYIIMGNADSKL
jgi:hypothetical protein